MSGEYQTQNGVLRDLGAAIRDLDDDSVDALLLAAESAMFGSEAVNAGLRLVFARLRYLCEIERARRMNERERLNRDFRRQPSDPLDGWTAAPPETKDTP